MQQVVAERLERDHVAAQRRGAGWRSRLRLPALVRRPPGTDRPHPQLVQEPLDLRHRVVPGRADDAAVRRHLHLGEGEQQPLALADEVVRVLARGVGVTLPTTGQGFATAFNPIALVPGMIGTTSWLQWVVADPFFNVGHSESASFTVF